MNIDFQINVAEFENMVESKIENVKLHVAEAMTATVYDIVMRNFGSPPGLDRPAVWDDLSESYAKRVGRTYATLNKTGAMKAAIQKPFNADGGRVYLSKGDCVYALAHHFGYKKNNLPARRVFPINEDGSITDYTIAAVTAAAETALREALK